MFVAHPDPNVGGSRTAPAPSMSVNFTCNISTESFTQRSHFALLYKSSRVTFNPDADMHHWAEDHMSTSTAQ